MSYKYVRDVYMCILQLSQIIQDICMLSEKIIQASISMFWVEFVNVYTCFYRSNGVKGQSWKSNSDSEIQFNYKSLQIHVRKWYFWQMKIIQFQNTCAVATKRWLIAISVFIAYYFLCLQMVLPSNPF